MASKIILTMLAILLTPLAVGAADTWQAKLATALDSPLRSEPEKARDANRLPAETLAFMGLRDDMRVLELFPGTGWYTKLLAPVLADRGSLYLALGTNRIADLIARTPELETAEVLDINPLMTSTDIRGVFDLEPFSFWVDDIDLVLTFRNAHNLTPAGRNVLNEAVFDALRPGGHYGVIDHTRRHMEPDGPENPRRVDPVRLIHETLAAGFKFVAWSDLHYRPDDELRYEVGRRSVTGNTDRFTLLFRKPEN
ncbi:MAG: methyltransferase [Gammaproteobacteria bacterium]|nr:methyltransferase [Gammaproteobacteria bacterium]